MADYTPPAGYTAEEFDEIVDEIVAEIGPGNLRTLLEADAEHHAIFSEQGAKALASALERAGA